MIKVTTFYQFFPLTPEKVSNLEKRLYDEAQELKGLIILGKEGFNATIAGSEEAIETYKLFIQDVLSEFQAPPAVFKDSECDFTPFRLFKVKVRPEIVTLGDETIIPDDLNDETHLNPEEWDKMLQDENVVCIDTRNWYETDLGHFKSAILPPIDDFQEFPEYLEKNVPKDKTVLMYCTGGIRCEKAAIDAKQRGYKAVYQLKGGILNYLQERPNKEYEGECFVFDHRVAVDQELKMSKNYRLCPHCGQPGKVKISCKKCDSDAIVCQSCLDKAVKNETCSKNCAYHYELNPNKKGNQQKQGYRASLENR